MGRHADKAAELFENGCTCSQAVLLAYAEELGLDRETAMKLSVGLGGGVGRMRETCGAVTGMTLVAGLKLGNTDPSDSATKNKAMATVNRLAGQFKAQNRSLVCKELLGLEPLRGTTERLTDKPPCKELVRQAADLLESL